MADPNHIDPVALRIFARKFAGVELTHFARFERSEIYPDVGTGRAHHIVVFNGPEAELVRLGLVDADCIPQKPKRLYYNETFTCQVDRLKGGRLKVRRELYDYLDRSHPLYDLAPWNWPLIESPAQARSVALEELQWGTQKVLKVFRGGHQWHLNNCIHGQRVGAADRQRLDSIIDRFEQEILAATEAVRFESEQRPRLSLVVSR